MFSYRHGFHAGNHADVLKHTILSLVLDYFRSKDAAFLAIDTHAGAGIYDLTGDWANKKAEYVQGAGRIWNLLSETPLTSLVNQEESNSPGSAHLPVPSSLESWLTRLRALNATGPLRYYPGSPWIWLHNWRKQDRLKLIEQLPVEAEVLRRNLQQLRDLPPRSVQVLEQDGFQSLKALLPPPSRRAIVLIDPSYEDKQDYHRVIAMLKDAMSRFATGCYIVWYPKVNRLQVEQLRKQLRKLTTGDWIDIDMTVTKPPVDGHGLFGSGCFVINPPYTLGEQMKQAMPWLTRILAVDTSARWTIESGQGRADAPMRGTERRNEASSSTTLARQGQRPGKPRRNPAGQA